MCYNEQGRQSRPGRKASGGLSAAVCGDFPRSGYGSRISDFSFHRRQTVRKTILILVICMLLAVGCAGRTADANAAEAFVCATMGDALAAAQENVSSAFTEHYGCCIFEKDGMTYRAVAEMPADVSEKIWALEYDENYDRNVADLLSGLPLLRFENLTEAQPSQADCDALVGKTGQELFDDGWSSCGYNLETGEFWMEHGAYAYTVFFDAAFDPDATDPDAFDEYEAIAPLTVRSVTCTGVGSGASNVIDELETALTGG